MPRYHTIVIGAGLAGLTAACTLAQAKKKTLLVSSGIGALVLSSGCIDVLGYQPTDSKTPLLSPLDGLPAFLADWPEHPYHLLGAASIEAGLETFAGLVNAQGLTYEGSADRNWLLPSAAGAIHPTALAPASLAAGDLAAGGKILIVGFTELRDFYPALISDNLNAQDLGVTTAPITLNAPSPVAGRLDITPLQLAEAFEVPDFRQQVASLVKKAARDYDRVAFPAVLGLQRHADAMAYLEHQLGKPVFEISTLPPSAPGRRLFEALKAAFLDAGGRLLIGSKVLDGQIENGGATQISHETVTRPKTIRAEHYVLAAGGIYGGGLQTNQKGKVWEPVFGLPVTDQKDRQAWFEPEPMSPAGHALHRFGIRVNERFNPVDADDKVIANNLYVIGNMLAGTNWIQGRTGEGVAVASAVKVAKLLGD